MKLKLGHKYKTKGGWTAFISTFINGNPQGWCKDSFGVEEPLMGTWDENTGKCLKRGEFVDASNIEPYDIIDAD
jgi:hypothetical protein